MYWAHQEYQRALSLLWTWCWTRCNVQTIVNQAINQIPVNWMILLYYAVPEYCGVMVIEKHLLGRGRLIVRGVYYKQCVESRLIWDKSRAFICIWKGASTRSCISFDVSASIVKHINDDLLYFDQCTNFKSSWPFRTVLRLGDKLRVTDILEEYKSRVEEGCDKKQERD